MELNGQKVYYRFHKSVPDESSAQPRILKVNFNIILRSKPRSQVVCCLQDSRLNLCMHFSSLPCLLHAAPVGKDGGIQKRLNSNKVCHCIHHTLPQFASGVQNV
jgi:hypothetical protein